MAKRHVSIVHRLFSLSRTVAQCHARKMGTRDRERVYLHHFRQRMRDAHPEAFEVHGWKSDMAERVGVDP